MSKQTHKELDKKQGALGANERWSVRRKREVVLRLLRGEPLDALSRELGVEVYRLEQWREKAVLGIDEALKDRTGDPLEAELDAAKRHIGELSMVASSGKGSAPPFSNQEVVEMSREASPTTGKPYGVQRICRICGFPRSTLYARAQRNHTRRPVAKRGPQPVSSDAQLLELIRLDLKESPFSGEGHRKVWARLKYGRGVSVSRKRVLRLMHDNHLLSPHRRPCGVANEHTGTITTQEPNAMWGADGTRVFTLEDGHAWVFTAIEHWNGECVGWHVTKKGNRFAALEPVAQGVLSQFGHVGRDAARGLAVRMDHGTQYLSEHFQHQLTFWGIAPSFAFLEQPQTNGVAERFFRTLKEQVIYGRIFRTVAELRQAVGDFIERYNRQWQLEKNGYRSPAQMREAWAMKAVA
jgi:putative transposase